MTIRRQACYGFQDADVVWCRLMRGHKGDLIARIQEGTRKNKIVILYPSGYYDAPLEDDGKFVLVIIDPKDEDVDEEKERKFEFGSVHNLCVFDPDAEHRVASVAMNAVPVYAADSLHAARILYARASRAVERKAIEEEEHFRNERKLRDQEEITALEDGRACCGEEGEELVRLMRRHDWYYDYTDDGAVWRRGWGQYVELQTLVARLGDKGAVLWNRHCPEGLEQPVDEGLDFPAHRGCGEEPILAELVEDVWASR